LAGTETGGSLVYPASKAGVYGMKPTWGSVSTAGAFRISRSFDGIGGMAKTPADLASLIETILLPEARAKVPADGYESFMTGNWEGLRIGVVESTWGGANVEKWGSGIVVSLELLVMGGGVNGLLGRNKNTKKQSQP
jgi:amidase